ncbi:MAG TPA: DUF222 domain-containing protein [Streptosporangiaceae bacterium]|nr:DUF222 domain-containing protein [Streptosporangiaceae bacterium]
MAELGGRGQPASTAEAIAAVTSGLRYLTRVDAVALGAAGQAECLKALEAAEAMHTAARVNVLAAFSTGQGYQADGCGSERSWLVWQTRVTRAAAAGSVAWLRRLRGHRPIWEALAAGTLSPSWARQICEWTGRLPAASREDADAILLAAASAGADLYDLSTLAHEMYLRSCTADTDRDRFEDRSLYFARTFGQAGRLEADLTPAAAAAVRAVLDSLGAKAGPEDTRTRPQREHDALEEACIRLIQSGMLPQRAGQPVHLQLQITLDQLWAMAGKSQAEAVWTASGSGLTSEEAQALACDATIFPTVVGRVNDQALDELVQLFLTAPAHRTPPPATPPAGLPESPERLLRRALLAKATEVLSGPDGLAALLRRGLAAYATVSLPLDVGEGAEIIPAHLRRAIIVRDQHCRFPGCFRPPAVCQVHHLIHREDGGATSLTNCALVCRFHHLIVIHRWRWRLILNPDGTTTATSPDGRILHSHSPPGQAA